MNAARDTFTTRDDALTLMLLNDWQRDFPLVDEPFAQVAQQCGSRADAVLAGYQQLANGGALSRIGGVWAAGAGGAALLCAMRVPPDQLAVVAQQVSDHPEVNHNYEREHVFNLWFVVTGRNAAAVEASVVAMEHETGLPAMRLPMRRVYRIDLGFDLKSADTSPRVGRGDTRASVPPVDAADARLAALAEAGLPLVARPYDVWAQTLGCPPATVLRTLQRWVSQGTLRRFGVVVRHHEVGFDQNAMTVFDVPDDAVDRCGAALARQAGVTLCYQRARAPGWPYNLYCMVHGRERAAVQAQITRAAAQCGLVDYPHNVLFSRQRFKQAGGRYFRELPSQVPHAAA
jgi:DNA-binding Lrp family transcriptional regulator